MQRKNPGFTLVELLVVVAVIVVLLALLMPALDKAIYQTELAVCGAKQKGVGSGLTTYAVQNRRAYPERSALWSAHQFVVGQNLTNGTSFDSRHVMRRVVPNLNKSFNCPLVKPVNIEDALLESNTYGTYSVYAGWKFGMRRLGARWEYGGRSFGVLAMDFDIIGPPLSIWSSHPDDTGGLWEEVLQDRGDPPIIRFTASSWVSTTGPVAGNVDLNVTFDDGSVNRYGRVLLADPATNRTDDRMTLVESGQGSFSTVPW